MFDHIPGNYGPVKLIHKTTNNPALVNLDPYSSPKSHLISIKGQWQGHVSTWHDATILHTQILLILSLRRGCKVLAGCWLFFLNTNSSYNPMSPSKQNEEPGALLLSSAHRKNSPSLLAPSYVLEKGYHIGAIHFCDQSWGLADSARNSVASSITWG